MFRLKIATRVVSPVTKRSYSQSHRLNLQMTSSLNQAKGKKKEAGPAGPAFEEKFDIKTQIPVNILKEGADPVYQADDKYPSWIYTLLEDKPILEDYIMKGLENAPPEKMKMVFRMANKRKIKAKNSENRKEAT